MKYLIIILTSFLIISCNYSKKLSKEIREEQFNPTGEKNNEYKKQKSFKYNPEYYIRIEIFDFLTKEVVNLKNIKTFHMIEVTAIDRVLYRAVIIIDSNYYNFYFNYTSNRLLSCDSAIESEFLQAYITKNYSELKNLKSSLYPMGNFIFEGTTITYENNKRKITSLFW